MRRHLLRTILIVVVLTLGAFTPTSPLTAQSSGQIDKGALALEALQREPITFELDIAYAATDNPRQRLDLYVPTRPASDKLPVIVFFHGGGWLMGSKSDGAGQLMPFVRSGEYAGVSVGYRLSGEATWPAQIHDSKAAIRWLRAHAAQYGLDPERIAVWGRSAGAHVALMVGLTADAPGLDGGLGPHREESSRVSGVVNFFGITDIMALIGQPGDIDRTSPQAPEALLIGGALRDNDDKAQTASPVRYATRGDPPVLTLHGTADQTVPYDQAVRLDQALTAAGVPSYFVSVAGGGHGGFPDQALDRVKQFFAVVLYGKDIEISTEPLSRRP